MTPKMNQLLKYIAMYTRNNDGISPNYDEMKAALGLASKSGINRMLVEMESRGLLSRIPCKARSIYLTEKGISLIKGNISAAAYHAEAQNG